MGCGFLFHFISLRPFLSLSLRGGYLITPVELFNIIPPKKPLIRLVLESAFIHRAKAAVLMRFPPGTIVIHSQKYSGMDSLSTERRFSSAIRVGPARGGAARETDEQKAESIVAGELKRHGWKESELGLRPKADKVKIALAKRLRKETTMTLKWIAARLQMGSWTYVFNLLSANRDRKQR